MAEKLRCSQLPAALSLPARLLLAHGAVPKQMSIATAPYPCSTSNLLQLQGRLVSMTARMDARFLTLTSKWKSNLSLRVSIPWHLEAQRKFPTLAPQRYGHFLVSHARQDCADDGNTCIATTMDRRATMSIARLDFCAFKLQCVCSYLRLQEKGKEANPGSRPVLWFQPIDRALQAATCLGFSYTTWKLMPHIGKSRFVALPGDQC